MNESVYDGDAAVEAMRRPALKVAGKTYTGKLISFQQAVAFQHRMKALENGSDDQVTMITELCMAIDIPVDALFQLPPGAVVGALQHFFACLLGGLPDQPSQARAPLPTS